MPTANGSAAGPIMLQDFLAHEHSRKRYWARSLVGWRRMRAARPNDAHRALARLEAHGRVAQLVTQNVDGLHQAAGSRNVIDLHGRVDVVRCLSCERRVPREQVQAELVAAQPALRGARRRSQRPTATPSSTASTSRRSTCRPAKRAAGC